MRNFFSGAFKDNKNLSYGFLTGILRIAQESIFSGLNNLTVNSVMDEEYESFFGFTSDEKDLGEEALDSFSDKALAQIDELRYDCEMKEDGIINILKFGIAFSGKKVRVRTK